MVKVDFQASIRAIHIEHKERSLGYEIESLKAKIDQFTTVSKKEYFDSRTKKLQKSKF
jgi:hypothetical protein